MSSAPAATHPPGTACGCVGPWHLDECELVRGPMDAYRAAEAQAWDEYAAAMEVPRRRYSDALRRGTKVSDAAQKKAKRDYGQPLFGGGFNAYMNAVMRPTMEAYAAAVEPERRAYWDAFQSAATSYEHQVSGFRRGFEEALVNFPAGLTKEMLEKNITPHLLVERAPLPDWLPPKHAIEEREGPQHERSGLRSGLFPILLMAAGAAALGLSSPDSPEAWTLVALMAGFALVFIAISRASLSLLWASTGVFGASGVIAVVYAGNLGLAMLAWGGGAALIATMTSMIRLMQRVRE